MQTELIRFLLKRLLTVVGVSAVSCSDDMLTQLVAAIVTILGIIWELWQSRHEKKAS